MFARLYRPTSKLNWPTLPVFFSPAKMTKNGNACSRLLNPDLDLTLFCVTPQLRQMKRWIQTNCDFAHPPELLASLRLLKEI